MNFFEKLRRALSEPSFFKEIKKEKLKGSIIFITIFAFVSYIYLTFFYIDKFNESLAQFNIYIELTLVNFIVCYLAFVAFFMIMAIFRFYIIHIFVRLFGGRSGYKETYKSLSYSNAPNFYTMPLFILLLVGYTTNRIMFFCMLPLYIIAVIYTIYLRSTALSKTQDISFWKALLSIYVLGTLVQLFAVIIIEIIIIGIYLAFFY